MFFLAPVSPGAPQLRVAEIPLDGSGRATTLADWKDTWGDSFELESGDALVMEGQSAFLRLANSRGAPSALVSMGAGPPGVGF